MAKRASSFLNPRTCAMSSSLRTASPRQGCQPTISTGRPLRITIWAASHHHTAPNLGHKAGFAGDRESKIGERSERDHHDSGIGFDGFNHGVNGVQPFRLLARRRIAVISDSVAAMKPGRALMDAI